MFSVFLCKCRQENPDFFPDPFRAKAYLNHVLHVPTPNVLGTAILFVEIAQDMD
jgi:hypothetical protein